MKKHLKHLKNPFPGTNFISGHFRPANRPNRDFSKFPKICQNRDFFKKSIFGIEASNDLYMYIWPEKGLLGSLNMFLIKYLYIYGIQDIFQKIDFFGFFDPSKFFFIYIYVKIANSGLKTCQNTLKIDLLSLKLFPKNFAQS